MSNQYYLYTGGVLKRVEREEPDYEKYYMGGAIDRATSCEVDRYADKEYEVDRNNWLNNVASLPSIQVSDDLKAIWKEGDRISIIKDFVFKVNVKITYSGGIKNANLLFDLEYPDDDCIKNEIDEWCRNHWLGQRNGYEAKWSSPIAVAVNTLQEGRQEESQEELWNDIEGRIATFTSATKMEAVRLCESLKKLYNLSEKGQKQNGGNSLQ